MNQIVLYRFNEIVNEKYYEFSCQPGTTYDEIDAIFVEFKKQFEILKENALKAEAEAKEKAESSSSEAPIEPELVA